MDRPSSSRLFLIMRDNVYRYCLYRITAPDIDEDESTICELEEPLYKFETSDFPKCMSFIAVGSTIYMVGGFSHVGNNPVYPSNKTFIYDTLSNTLVEGPLLIAGKSSPCLFTIGSKIYALSDIIDCDEFKSGGMDPQPQFEVLDTEYLADGWSALPVPRLYPSHRRMKCSIYAGAAAYVGHGTSSAIFLSFNDAGTYAFEVEKKLWSFVSAEKLPFNDDLKVIPPSPNCPYAPSLCNTDGLQFAFRFHYYSNEHDENNKVFKVDKYEIDNPGLKSPPLPPRTFHDRSLTAFGPDGRVYYVTGGIDCFDCGNTNIGDRYVKVSALDICKAQCDGGLTLKSGKKIKKKRLEKEQENETVKLELNKGMKGQLLKRCKKKERKETRDGEEGETIELEKKKRHEKELDETIKPELSQGRPLKRCNKKKKREMSNGEEDDEIVVPKMTLLWRSCFFGGPMCDMYEHVTAAFAM